MPKAPKEKISSKAAATNYLRTVLPTYAPGSSGTKSRRFLKDDWAQIEKALEKLGGSIAPDGSGENVSVILTGGIQTAVSDRVLAQVPTPFGLHVRKSSDGPFI